MNTEQTEVDLFEFPERLPENVREIVDKYCTGENDYGICAKLVDELERVGYTCDYGLDAEPIDLRRLPN